MNLDPGLKNKLIALILFLVSGCMVHLHAQVPILDWQISIGGSNEDGAESIIQNNDGTYVLGGYSNSNDGNINIDHENNNITLKLKNVNTINWVKSFNEVYKIHSVIKTNDNGYVLAGYEIDKDWASDSSSYTVYYDFWVAKTDSSGTLQWEKEYGGGSSERAYSIIQTSDNGFIVAGETGSNDGDVSNNNGSYDFWVVKLDGSGNLQWENTYGGSDFEKAYSIIQTADGDYIVAGHSNSSDGDVSNNHGDHDYWIIKINNTGDLQWEKSYGGSYVDFGESILQTADEGFLVVGESASYDGNISGQHGAHDYWIVKLDSLGNLQWQNAIGGSEYEWAKDALQTNDGSFLIAGYSNSSDGDIGKAYGGFDYWLVKLDTTGNLKWERSYGGSGDDEAKSIIKTNDGGFALAGRSNSTNGDVTGNHGDYDFWFAKIEMVEDTVAPVAKAQNITVSLDSSYQVSVPLEMVNNGSHDNGQIDTMWITPSSFDLSDVGDNETVLTVKDTSGNLSTDTSIITVNNAHNDTLFMQWQKCLGGSGDDAALSIDSCSDGAYIVAGASYSADGDVGENQGGMDYWIVKLDKDSNIEWKDSYGGSAEDMASSIKQTSDSGYIVAGLSNSTDGDVTGNHGNNDYWVIKLDSVGNIQWKNTYGGSNDDWASTVAQTDDGGYVVGGSSASADGNVSGNQGGSDYWVVKLDGSGNIQWQNNYGGSGREWINSVIQTSDGGYMALGMSDSNDGDVSGNHGNFDYWLIKLNSSGTLQWEKSLGGSNLDGMTDGLIAINASSLIQTNNNNLLLTGSTSSNDGDISGNHGNSDILMAKLDNSGNILWQKCLGGSDSEIGMQGIQVNDNGFVVTGIASSDDGDIISNKGAWDYWMIKTDNQGNILWQKLYGGSENDMPTSVLQLSSNEYIMAGSTLSDDKDVSGNHGGGETYGDMWITRVDKDTIAPTVMTSSSTFYLDSAGTVSINSSQIDSGSYDNVKIDTMFLDAYQFNCSHIGDTNITLFAEDLSGNIDSANAIVSIIDTIAPVGLVKDTTLYLNDSGMAQINSIEVDTGSYDNCRVDTSFLGISHFGCTDVGDNIIDYTVKDKSGNSTVKKSTITIIDTLKPTVITRDTLINLDTTGTISITPEMLNYRIYDNCRVDTSFPGIFHFGCTDVGDNIIDYTVKDKSGNSTVKKSTITIIDTLKPTVITRDTLINLDTTGTISITPEIVNNSSYDNCSIDTIYLDTSYFDTSDIGDNYLNLTAVDIYGNTNTGQAVVTVNSVPKPAFSSDPEYGRINQSITFDASESSDIGSNQDSIYFKWDWDSDGIWDTDYSRDKKIDHSFNKAGYFNVSLAVKDKYGATNFLSDTISVYNLMKCVFYAQNSTLENIILSFSNGYKPADTLREGQDTISYYIMPGDYSFEVKAPGYFSKYIDDISIGKDNEKFQSVQLAMIGDYNMDGEINYSDLDALFQAWNEQNITIEFGPVTGTPPELMVHADSAINFEDLLGLTFMWNHVNAATKNNLKLDDNLMKKGQARIDITHSREIESHIYKIWLKNAQNYRSSKVLVDYPENSLELADARQGNYFSKETGNFVFLTQKDNKRGIIELDMGKSGQSYSNSEKVLLGKLKFEKKAFTTDKIPSADYQFEIRENTGIISKGNGEVKKEEKEPRSIHLSSYPNPFKEQVYINFTLPEADRVTINIFNVKGEKIKTLLNDRKEAGNHSIEWNPEGISPGIYYYNFIYKFVNKTQKLLKVK